MMFWRIKKVFIASWVFLIPIIAEIICPNNLSVFLFRILFSHVESERCYCDFIQEFNLHNLIRINSGRKISWLQLLNLYFGWLQKVQWEKWKIVSNFVLEIPTWNQRWHFLDLSSHQFRFLIQSVNLNPELSIDELKTIYFAPWKPGSLF